MDRTEFIIATAILLFAAFCFGFVAHWIVNRLSHVSKADLGELDRMAEDLHQAEEARDSAIVEKEGLEAQLSQSEEELQAAILALREARSDAEELRTYVSRQNMSYRTVEEAGQR